MGENAAANALRFQLDRLTAAIVYSASQVGPGTAAVEIVRALDLRCFQVLRERRCAAEDVHGPDAGWYALEKPPWFGATRAFSILLDEPIGEVGEALAIGDESGAEWAEDVLGGGEAIARIEHWLSHHAAGHALVEQTPTGFVIRAHRPPLAVEAAEREEIYALDSLSREAHAREVAELRASRPSVLEALASRFSIRNGLVDVQPTSAIATHYERAGVLTAQRMWNDQETFDGDTVLGGEPFYLYRGATGILMGLALRHIDLVNIAVSHNPSLSPRYLLTVAGPISGLAKRVATHLGADLRETLKALENLTLTSSAAESYGAWPAAPPPLVQIARKSVAWSIAGTLAAPFEFLLTHLRTGYRAESDRAVNSREDRFRRELYHPFTGINPDRFAAVDRALAIREGGWLLTDVDALVFDRETGDLGLFQLKWQDSVGVSGVRLASGKRNFTFSTERWASQLSAWLRQRPLREAARALGLSSADCERVTHVQMFVIGRNFAHFSNAEPEDGSLAWATWPQFLNRVSQILAERSWGSGPLHKIYRTGALNPWCAHLNSESEASRYISSP